jgi:hypothetical protein
MERSRQKEHERVLAELDAANSKVSSLTSKLDAANSELNVANSKVTDLMQYIINQGLPLPEDK